MHHYLWLATLDYSISLQYSRVLNWFTCFLRYPSNAREIKKLSPKIVRKRVDNFAANKFDSTIFSARFSGMDKGRVMCARVIDVRQHFWYRLRTAILNKKETSIKVSFNMREDPKKAKVKE